LKSWSTGHDDVRACRYCIEPVAPLGVGACGANLGLPASSVTRASGMTAD
jgi:hypothetical protein